MKDLISSSFKRSNLSKKPLDLEAGDTEERVNLDTFFEDVENVKDDMKEVGELYIKLRDSNEECKVAHNANTIKELRSRMDSIVRITLDRVRVIKSKLQGLERSNAANRNNPGCGAGSSTDRTRISVVSGLGKKLKDMMDNFQGLRANMHAEYKETIERRYFTITGQKGDEAMIENLIASGESENFLQKAIQEQGRGQIMDTISEIKERHDSVIEMEKNLIELNQVFLDMAALVEAEGQQLNNIENHVANATSFVTRGHHDLVGARKQQKSSRKWFCFAILGFIILFSVIFFPLLGHIILPHLIDEKNKRHN